MLVFIALFATVRAPRPINVPHLAYNLQHDMYSSSSHCLPVRKGMHECARMFVILWLAAIARRGIRVYSHVHWDSGQQVLKAATAGRRMRTESDSGCEKSKVMYTGLLAFTIQVRCASLVAACSAELGSGSGQRAPSTLFWFDVVFFAPACADRQLYHQMLQGYRC